MLNLTRKVDYGVLLLTHLGLHHGEALSARQIAGEYRLSPSLTASVLKSLQRGELVRSTRGVKGGYTLNRTPGAINLSQIIEAVEGCWSMVECRTETASGVVFCDLYDTCPIRWSMAILGDQVREIFDRTTLESFIEQARACRERHVSGAPQGAPVRLESPLAVPRRARTQAEGPSTIR